jgi:4-diphosphocytidyl-2-C-methyl-D-erythritol kinase
MNAEVSGVVTLPAPARINLYLHITGRRADGYHEMDSLIVFSELGDTLSVRSAAGLTLEVNGPFAESLGGRLRDQKDNSVLRAANLLADAAQVPCDAAITLTKKLPLSSGLGGSSADAAATLKALAALWGIGDGDLIDIAMQLGVDVPVCLVGGPAFVGGTGEEVEAVPALPSAGLLLVNPGVALAASSVYGARRGGFSPAARFGEAPDDIGALVSLLEERENDLTAAATRLCPVIDDALAAIGAASGCRLARMTGIGATCFGLFDNIGLADRAISDVARDGWWVAATAFSGSSIA